MAAWTYRQRMGARRGPAIALIVLCAVLGFAVAGAAGTAVAGRSAAVAAGAPDKPYRVGVRTLDLARGPDRPLPTTVWFPVAANRVAQGRHPLVLFSHGLAGAPEHFAGLANQWAAAGFVVAAPAYPHTRAGVPLRRADLRHQPADATFVLRAVTGLAAPDPLAGHIDGGRVAAVGFSAGAYTTMGLFAPGHDPGLRAGVVISGREAPGRFGGAPVPMLFVHGDRDRVVPIASDRLAYAHVPWPKRFVTLPGRGHGEFLRPGGPMYAEVSALILEFLRDRLYGHVPAPAPRTVTA
ncbi:hypothetical protein Sya03_04320 [Spirilliplanes yamanashiensis]|uniref:Uncharacterized protein n=2 Tax=Spirilliplanes yamanashiensis TaxID=42233 RepID=A0A8J4DHD6_9ACTN|nr:hypothetical protein Sya03_04320 [Spirilliplanes yamanashiensis]